MTFPNNRAWKHRPVVLHSLRQGEFQFCSDFNNTQLVFVWRLLMKNVKNSPLSAGLFAWVLLAATSNTLA